MSDTTVEPAAEAAPAEHGEHREHTAEREYLKIAVILAVLTGLEVLTYFIDIGDALVPTLMILMVAKFFLVAAWFMHLKFDIPLFTKSFMVGLALAAGVYVAMLSMFQWWDAWDF